MKAYRVLFAVLLGATLAQTAPVAAQEQEDHIVVRRRYAVEEVEQKPDSVSPWYNNFTVSLLGGKVSHTEVVGYKEPSNNINLRSELIERDGPTLVFGFERLYHMDRYYIGPGVHLKLGERLHIPSCDIYAHGQMEFGSIGHFMGYNFSAMHPYVGASIGLSYLRYNGDYGHKKYKIEHHYSYYGNELYGYVWDNVEFDGIKFYADMDLGFTVDLAKHMALAFSYHVTLMPLIYSYLDLNDYSDYIHDIYFRYEDASHYIGMKNSTRLTLHHGVQVSFRF